MSVSVPLWLVIVGGLLAAWSFLDRLLVPSVRWVLRRRVNRALEELNQRLHIRIQPFKLTRREVLIDRLCFDPEVLEAAEAYALEEHMPRSVAMDKVRRYAQEITPAFNAYAYFRLGYWLSRRVARALYRVRLGYADEAGMAAIPQPSTVVFVMNHRSNMDYVLVSYLAAERTALSYAVGEWARIWPLQTLIRATGAYYVRRRSRNALYRKVLERYVHMATAGGVTQAVFPEGGLSRDGALREPKLGLLDYMVRGFDPKGERDIVFVPVGINYDRVLEDRTLMLDLDPGPGASDGAAAQRAPALWTTCRFVGRNLRLLARGKWHRFGYACVNFGTPLSLRALAAEWDADPRTLQREERFARVGELAERLMEAIGAVIPVLPVPLVATVFLRAGDRPLSELEIKAGVAALSEETRARGGQIYLPRADQDYAVAVGLRMLELRHMVDRSDGLYRAQPDQRTALQYYANSVAHLLPAASENLAEGDRGR
jgi:glycerol-3-phosphate O-acyltransferase